MESDTRTDVGTINLGYFIMMVSDMITLGNRFWSIHMFQSELRETWVGIDRKG